MVTVKCLWHRFLPEVFSQGFAAGDFGQRPTICRPMANTEASSCPRAKKKKNSGTHGILTSPEIKKVLTLMFCRQVRQSVVGY